MSLIIQTSEGVNCVRCMAKNPANVLHPSSSQEVFAQMVCLLTKSMSKSVGMGGEGGASQ